MDHNMAFILPVTELILAIFLIFLLIIVASDIDKSKPKDEQLRGTRFEASSDKFQQTIKLDPLVKSTNELKRLLIPILEITQRHERILSGSQSKGALGEQFVEERLKDLPLEWYDRNVRFLNGTTVEFALRAPNRRWVPIDSQWTVPRLLEQLGRANDQSHRNAFRPQVHAEVTRRAREARKYVDKDCTLGFCIVAVPDSVFELSVDAQAELTSIDIVLISYSLLVPFILLIVNQFLKTPQSAETLRISHIIGRFASQIEVIQAYINKEVMPPLGIVKLQQTQHDRRNRGIDHVHRSMDEIQSDINELKSGLNEIQSELNVVRNMFNPIPNKDIDSIPKILQRSLNLVRDGLLEAVAKQNGHVPDSADK